MIGVVPDARPAWGEDALAAHRVIVCSLFAVTVYLLVRPISRLRAPVPLRASAAS